MLVLLLYSDLNEVMAVMVEMVLLTTLSNLADEVEVEVDEMGD